MAKEIIATFQNGGIFDGVANSYTLNGETTYYFDIDKRYRVAVTDDGQIVSQQYQNTNGAWYNIDIITKIEIKDISGDVTVEYLKENYYTKSEADDRYVNKTGDIMTGDLYLKYNNSAVKVTSNSITLFDGIDTNVIKVQLYNGNVFLNGSVYYSDRIISGSTPDNFFAISIDGLTRSSGYTTPFNFNCPVAFNARTDLFNWLYIRDHSDGSVTGIIQNNGNIAMYGGHGFYSTQSAFGASNPQWIQISGTQVSGSPITFTNNVVLQAKTISHNSIYIDPISGSSGNTVLSAGNITVYSSLNNNNSQRSEINGSGFYHRYNYSGTYMWLNYRYQRYVNSGQTKVEIADGGLDLYNGAGTTYHSGAAGITEQYTRMNNNGITLYNTTSGEFIINTNGHSLRLQSLMGNGATAFRINVPGAHYSLTEGSGTVTGTGLYKTVNEGFYSESMLNALNLFLTYLQNNIKSAVTTFNKVSIIDFNPFDLGGGTRGRGGRIGG